MRNSFLLLLLCLTTVVHAQKSSTSDAKKSKEQLAKTVDKPAVYATQFSRVDIQNVTILNGDKDDFSPVFVDNGLMYCSNSKKKKKKDDDKEEVDDYNLKYAPFDSLGNLTKPTSFANRINSKNQEGPSCFSGDGKTMFLTRVMTKNTKDASGFVGGEGTNKIYIKTKDSTGWTGGETFAFESNKYNYCHPTLSADGKKLYFASNMAGGFGGMDIYMIRRLPDGSWTQPINLGPRVNTAKNELFPYISEKGILYFSSNGIPNGKGGLDLYRIEIDNRTARTTSLGDAFNTEGDDFGIMFLPKNEKKGYFSSNRPGGSGGDDIYQFVIKN